MEASFLAQQFVPLMFIGLFVFLLTGFPVAFALAACGLSRSANSYGCRSL